MAHAENYPLSDFPIGFDPSALVAEIEASGIVTALSVEKVYTLGQTAVVSFKVPPSDEDLVILDGRTLGDEDPPSPAQGLIAAHDPANATTQSLPVTLSGVKVDSDQRIETAQNIPIGDEIQVYSHNFCDPHTWYPESVRETDETVDTQTGPQDGTTWLFASTGDKVIDLKHGRLTGENKKIEKAALPWNAPTYHVVVTVNGVEYTEQHMDDKLDGEPLASDEYSIDYENRTITFEHDVSSEGPILVSYSRATDCRFCINARPGYKGEITYAEAQFSDDFDMDRTFMQRGMVRAGAVYDVPTLAALGLDANDSIPVPDPVYAPLNDPEYKTLYKNVDNFIDDAVEGIMTVPKVGTGPRSNVPMKVMKFRYKTAKPLGGVAEVHIALGMVDKNDNFRTEPYPGTRMTASFYGRWIPIT